jgi:hypothetical protein
MGLQRDQYTVYVQDPTEDDKLLERVATITHQDMLRGEQAMLGQPGLDLGHGLQLTTAWCWASLMRQGDYAGSWQAFRDFHCQGVEKLGTVDVDPTPTETGDAPP